MSNLRLLVEALLWWFWAAWGCALAWYAFRTYVCTDEEDEQ